MPPSRKKTSAKVPAKAAAAASDQETSDSDSGPDDRNSPAQPPPAKKSKSAGDGDTSSSAAPSSSPATTCAHRSAIRVDDRPTWQLNAAGGKDRFITVGDFKGKTYVNVREYYEKDGKKLPGKGGIALPLDQWQRLCECVADVNATLAELGHK